EAKFDEAGVQLVRTEATGGVRYHITRMVARREGAGEVKQEIEGTGGQAIYDVEKSRVELLGNIEATLTDPETLLVPAKLSVSSIVVYSDPSRYEFAGTAGHSRLEMTP